MYQLISIQLLQAFPKNQVVLLASGSEFRHILINLKIFNWCIALSIIVRFGFVAQMIAYDRKCKYVSFFRKNTGNEFSIKWNQSFRTHFVKRRMLCTDTILKVCVYIVHTGLTTVAKLSSVSIVNFKWYSYVATAPTLADMRLIFISFHFIAEANIGKWQKIIATHEHRT